MNDVGREDCEVVSGEIKHLKFVDEWDQIGG